MFLTKCCSNCSTLFFFSFLSSWSLESHLGPTFGNLCSRGRRNPKLLEEGLCDKPREGGIFRYLWNTVFGSTSKILKHTTWEKPNTYRNHCKYQTLTRGKLSPVKCTRCKNRANFSWFFIQDFFVIFYFIYKFTWYRFMIYANKSIFSKTVCVIKKLCDFSPGFFFDFFYDFLIPFLIFFWRCIWFTDAYIS